MKIPLGLVFATQLACGHTREVAEADNPDDRAPAEASTRPSDDAASDVPAKGPARAPRRPEKASTAPAEGEEQPPPLSTSPAGLLAPGAIERIQARLSALGFLAEDARSGKLDARTRKALRGFQDQHNLPATGTPDELTLQKLGLPVDDLLRSSK